MAGLVYRRGGRSINLLEAKGIIKKAELMKEIKRLRNEGRGR